MAERCELVCVWNKLMSLKNLRILNEGQVLSKTDKKTVSTWRNPVLPVLHDVILSDCLKVNTKSWTYCWNMNLQNRWKEYGLIIVDNIFWRLLKKCYKQIETDATLNCCSTSKCTKWCHHFGLFFGENPNHLRFAGGVSTFLGVFPLTHAVTGPYKMNHFAFEK